MESSSSSSRGLGFRIRNGDKNLNSALNFTNQRQAETLTSCLEFVQ